MSEQATCKLWVNDQEREVRACASATLLQVLRDELALTGTKRGCNQGVCGACTVWMDGRPVRSCLTLAANVLGRKITTIEGLASDGKLTRLQQCFIDHGALQCGFCTPGMIMTLEAALRENASPTAADVREAISGNLCRCTGYAKIVEAALDACSGEQS